MVNERLRTLIFGGCSNDKRVPSESSTSHRPGLSLNVHGPGVPAAVRGMRPFRDLHALDIWGCRRTHAGEPLHDSAARRMSVGDGPRVMKWARRIEGAAAMPSQVERRRLRIV